MSTFLFNKVIFGPVHSRRLGVSLGVNLLPVAGKRCTFDCIYCECGWTPQGQYQHAFTEKALVVEALEQRLQTMSEQNEELDSITFAGNGEPTIHPDFPEIVEEVIRLRNQYFPRVSISVLSNATMIKNQRVVDSLNKIENNILKLDAGTETMIRRINRPLGHFSVDELVGEMEQFSGNLIIQTMFLRGVSEGMSVDNTTEEELKAWLDILKIIRPKLVMLYSLDRGTPADDLQKVSADELKAIGQRLEQAGIAVQLAD